MPPSNDGTTGTTPPKQGGGGGSEHGQRKSRGSAGRRRNRKRSGGGGGASQHGGSQHGSEHGSQHGGSLHGSQHGSEHSYGGPASGKKKGKSPNQQQHSGRKKTPKKSNAPADMTVIINRADLWDIARDDEHSHHHYHGHHQANLHVAPYHFAPDVSSWISMELASPETHSVTVVRARRAPKPSVHVAEEGGFNVIDTSIPNPHPSSVVHDKYWCQRRRLFSKFDMGVLLDAEGWFSVTPEIIADHVARRVGDLSRSAAFRRGMPGSDIREHEGIVVLDAFCGCGGNALAFGKIPSHLISLVICVDVDRSKLQKAAYNASLYEIPKEKLVFVECNTMFILQHCFKNGERVQGESTPVPVETESFAGYQIGGLDLLPSRIDAIFMDPPWGGVDYIGLKDGYDLAKHMRIYVGPEEPATAVVEEEPEPAADGALGDDFFDTFGSSQHSQSKNAGTLFNETPTDGEYVNGVELLKMAAAATKSRLVIYDIPRNTNKKSLGQAALKAGYRGNLKLEEHYLNGRLKTVTAYMGADYSSLLR